MYSARAPAIARAPVRLLIPSCLLNDDLRLHPRVDGAHEVELAALLRRDLGGGLVADVRADEDRVTRLVEVGGAGCRDADAVIRVQEGRRGIALDVRIDPMLRRDLLADRALVELLDRLREILLRDD